MGMHTHTWPRLEWDCLQSCCHAPLRSGYPVPTNALMASAHPWESPPQGRQAPSQYAAPWDDPDYNPEPDSDADPDPHNDPEAAANEFVDMLVELYLSSKLSARTLSVLCYWAQKAGMPGLVSQYAMRPDIPHSGNYQKHLDRALGFDVEKTKLYTVAAPGYPRGELGRGTIDLPMRPPHELIEEEFERDPALPVKLQEMCDGGGLPPAYWEHPLLKASDTTILPTALYCDAVPYNNTDSAVGVCMINLVTGTRHIAGIIRKQIHAIAGMELPSNGGREVPREAPRRPRLRCDRHAADRQHRGAPRIPRHGAVCQGRLGGVLRALRVPEPCKLHPALFFCATQTRAFSMIRRRCPWHPRLGGPTRTLTMTMRPANARSG